MIKNLKNSMPPNLKEEYDKKIEGAVRSILGFYFEMGSLSKYRWDGSLAHNFDLSAKDGEDILKGVREKIHNLIIEDVLRKDLQKYFPGRVIEEAINNIKAYEKKPD